MPLSKGYLNMTHYDGYGHESCDPEVQALTKRAVRQKVTTLLVALSESQDTDDTGLNELVKELRSTLLQVLKDCEENNGGKNL
jgi:hypothetical protein